MFESSLLVPLLHKKGLAPLMQFKIIAFLILASSAGVALAQAAPAPVAPTAVATATSVEVAEQKAHAATRAKMNR